jgi:hypothetical protein
MMHCVENKMSRNMMDPSLAGLRLDDVKTMRASSGVAGIDNWIKYR